MLAILFASLLLPLIVNAGVTLIVDGHEEQTIPSFDFIQTPFKPFNRTGYYVQARLQLNNSTRRCEASLAYPPPGKVSSMTFDKYNSSVLMVRWGEGLTRCKLQTFSQTWSIVHEFMDTMHEYHLPPCDTIVMASLMRHVGEPGNPHLEPFGAS